MFRFTMRCPHRLIYFRLTIRYFAAMLFAMLPLFYADMRDAILMLMLPYARRLFSPLLMPLLRFSCHALFFCFHFISMLLSPFDASYAAFRLRRVDAL